MVIIGRRREQVQLADAYESARSELVAVYGRRRVGKTYLIRNFLSSRAPVYFELVGQKKETGESASTQHQLANFQYAWKRAFGEELRRQRSWDEAFGRLKEKVDELAARNTKVVVFIDELPWLCTPNSGFYENLDQAWNACFDPAGCVKLVLCGSASTWMLKRVVHARAGLSRRVTLKIHLGPFTLAETAEYLRYQGFDLAQESVADLYMVFGGIPYYLNFLSPRKSIFQNIDDECFAREGHLRDEYGVMLASLFADTAAYRRAIEILSAKRSGMTFDEVQALFAPRLKGRSSTLQQVLTNLCECTLVERRPQLFSKKRGALYVLTDEFVCFYLKWVAPLADTPRASGAYWQSISGSPSYNSWLGFSFEMLCLRHQAQIRRALGLHQISAVPGTFFAYETSGKRSAQIDLLFDRSDRTITVCELKHAREPVELTEADLVAIQRRKAALKEYLKSQRTARRDIVVAYVTLHGLAHNRWFNQLQPSCVVLSDLFAEP